MPPPKLGQHFLTDARYRQRILEALDLRDDDVVVEIGAGRGAMTELLPGHARHVIAIELDPTLARHLEERVGQNPTVEVLRGDILRTDVAELCRRASTDKCFVFGNLPYYITSPILHHLFEYRSWIRAMGLLVQREVAARLIAWPGTRTYGYLTVLTQLYSEARVALSVPPGAFSPQPKVHSTLVRFEMRPRFAEPSSRATGSATEAPRLEPGDEQPFLEFVKRCFAQKRKKLANNLASIYPRERIEQALARLSLPSSIRAEQTAIEQFADLYLTLRNS